MVRALVSVCPESVNDIDYGSRTPLHYAARKGRVAVATHLLESGAAADYRYLYYYMRNYFNLIGFRAMVFQLNLKYQHVKITNLLWVVV